HFNCDIMLKGSAERWRSVVKIRVFAAPPRLRARQKPCGLCGWENSGIRQPNLQPSPPSFDLGVPALGACQVGNVELYCDFILSILFDQTSTFNHVESAEFSFGGATHGALL
ncbi:MAG: hypothetical protein IKH04_12615, partial [Kiritimatiellae bacterium]|nr:hypothetical protein [Kiritimatiellia bacterium]